jgi:hypothetical protein
MAMTLPGTHAPIDIGHRAVTALTEDIAMFEAMGYQKAPTEASKQFFRSLLHHSRIYFGFFCQVGERIASLL